MKFSIMVKGEKLTFCEFDKFINETSPTYRKELLSRVEEWCKKEISKVDESSR